MLIYFSREAATDHVNDGPNFAQFVIARASWWLECAIVYKVKVIMQIKEAIVGESVCHSQIVVDFIFLPVISKYCKLNDTH